jgi:hypothetical protein
MRTTTQKMKAEALDSTRIFFESCVPEHLRPHFLPIARLVAPEDLDEVNSLKERINSEPVCIPSYSQSCERYKVVSKKLIIRVAFELMKGKKKKAQGD